jgi:hypothetical protein
MGILHSRGLDLTEARSEASTVPEPNSSMGCGPAPVGQLNPAIFVAMLEL